MAMTRQERVILHKKQERIQISKGEPSLSELREGVPVLRDIKNGVFEYVKHNGVLYKKELERG